MAKDTRAKILAAALKLFAQRGYEGANIRELTASLGMAKSSMYRHFESKEAIWSTLLDGISADCASSEHLPSTPDSPEALVAMTTRMADDAIRDEKRAMTRRLLAIEQFHDERARALATRHFLTGPAAMFAPAFADMMDRGLLRREDPAALALAYTAPITALIQLCDREPDKIPEALAQVEAFSRRFIKACGMQARGDVAVRGLAESEIPAALALAWRVFSEYESQDHSPEGAAEFRECLEDEFYLRGIAYYGAFDGERPVGMLGIRREQRHICFFFVDGPYQRLGAGTRLFERMREDFSGQVVTLNASPYSLTFCTSLGFWATDGEQTVNGLRFTPMRIQL